MAKNYVQRGDVITIPAPAAVASGEPVIAGEIVGIAQGDAKIGAAVDVAVSGVWRLPKAGIDDIALGAKVYWDASAELATTTASDNTQLGVAVAAAGPTASSVNVRLSGF